MGSWSFIGEARDITNLEEAVKEKVKTEKSSEKKVDSTSLTRTSSTVTSDVSEVVNSVMPSVVSITNMSVQQVQSFFGGTRRKEVKSSGSGIIVRQNDTESRQTIMLWKEVQH